MENWIMEQMKKGFSKFRFQHSMQEDGSILCTLDSTKNGEWVEYSFIMKDNVIHLE